MKEADKADKEGDAQKSLEHRQAAANHAVEQRRHRIQEGSKRVMEKIRKFEGGAHGDNSLGVVAAAAGEMARVELMGMIGKSPWDGSGISEKEFRDALDCIPLGTKFTVAINSQGGSVQEGLGMYAALKERREDSTCRIGGYAVSIASIIPLGAGRVISPDAAIWMMHKSWVDTSGNEDGLRETADALHVHDEMMVDIYAAETGKSKKAVREAMAGA